MNQRRAFIAVLLFSILLLVACGDRDSSDDVPTAAVPASVDSVPTDGSREPPTQPSTEAEVPTEIPATPTPSEPLAALVNDQPIFLSAYEKELARYEQAQAELGERGTAADRNYRELVLNALIERLLISQAAEAQGLSVTPDQVDLRIQELRTAAGESGNFDAWLQANQWTEEEFRVDLSAEMLAEKVVAEVTANVPFAVEQVHARYLQVSDPALAQSLLEQARGGADFAQLASQHSLDRVTAQNGGDLGFFARGSLLVPAVEAAAFELEPEAVSEVITSTPVDGSQETYYLVQVVERDPQRPLSADLRYTLLQQAFESWLEAQWEQAAIIRYVDTDA